MTPSDSLTVGRGHCYTQRMNTRAARYPLGTEVEIVKPTEHAGRTGRVVWVPTENDLDRRGVAMDDTRTLEYYLTGWMKRVTASTIKSVATETLTEWIAGGLPIDEAHNRVNYRTNTGSMSRALSDAMYEAIYEFGHGDKPERIEQDENGGDIPPF